jgi:FPC/CPF motif-containing protein YcgG
MDSKQFGWDTRVNSDPSSSDFSFSLGEEAFFIVGLHPNSLRKARQFESPLLMFNLHDQFERMRESGTFESFQKQIRKNDLAFSGSLNPNLDDFGMDSEARQYSGKKVDEEWRCPLKVNKNYDL